MFKTKIWKQTSILKIFSGYFLCCSLSCFGQEENILPCEGERRKITIDRTTPLKDLIEVLEKGWPPYEALTEFFGFTPEMFSIAAHQDSAITPLVNLIRNTRSRSAQIGGLRCLYLIGINNTPVKDKFTNAEARKALLGLLPLKPLQDTIIQLLIRDPWVADVPVLISILKLAGDESLPIVNALSLNKVNTFPVLQKLPDRLSRIEISKKNEEYGSDAIEQHYKYLLSVIKNLNNSSIVIEDTLFHSDLAGEIINYMYIGDGTRRKTTKASLSHMLDDLAGIDHFIHKSKIKYYVRDEKLYICSNLTTKKIILSWWDGLSHEEKNNFIGKKHF
jgi:hypothetical protein